MESQVVETSSSRKETGLLLLTALIFAGGLFAFYYFDPKFPVVVRLLILLAAIGAAAAVGWRTQMGQSVWDAISGARVELRKVVWPSKQESVQTTLLIAAVVVFFAFVMWILDSGLLWGVSKLTGRG